MRTLERSLTQRDLVLLVVGTVIGSGIFIVPATVLAQVGGDVRLSYIVWIAGGILSLLGALTYGELGALKPEAGGLYIFMRDAFGPFTAFLFGWTLFMAIGAGSLATLAAAFVGYLGEFVTLAPGPGRLVAVGVVGLVAAINIRGTRTSTRVTNWTTATKVGALLVMSVALIAVPGAPDETRSRVAFEVGMLPAMGMAMIGVLWAFEGWQWSTFAAGETREPHRVFPRGILIGTLALVFIYLLANVAYVSALGPERASRSASIASAAVGAQFGPAAGRLIAAAILVSIFSAANATVLTGSRVFYAMARDGLFFRRMGEIHATRGTPVLAIAAFCLWAMALAATGTFEQLLTYVVFTGWIFYALGAAAVFVLRRTEPDRHRPFRVPGYPVTPLLFVLAAFAIVLNTLMTQPARGGLGLAVVLTGVPAYLVWRPKGPRP